MYNNGGALNILNSTLASNVANATSGSGGAIFSASGSVAIVNSQLSFNSATRAGGGIEVVDGTLSMLHTILVRNDVNGTAGAASPGNGGGLHVSGSATITIANGIITGNSAASEGGGLWNQAGSTMTVVDSLIFRIEARGNDVYRTRWAMTHFWLSFSAAGDGAGAISLQYHKRGTSKAWKTSCGKGI